MACTLFIARTGCLSAWRAGTD